MDNIGKTTLSGLVSKIRNIDGKPLRSAIRNVKPSTVHEGDALHDATGSFATVVRNISSKKVVKVQVMHNKERVDGAAVAIPLEAVEAISSRFENTLYGYWKDRGHTLATISIEYEWKPPRCSNCLVFAHTSDNCPTLHKETPVATNKDNTDGFTVVQKKKSGKANQNQKKKQIEGIRLTKSALNLQYRKVDKLATYNLHKVCSSVFRHWDWSSNSVCCKKGTRIILGWNHNDVDVMVLNQDDQTIHTRVWLKLDKKEVFCSFIYAHNGYIQRRELWQSLKHHKVYVSNRPWCLLGDFNATLFLEQSTAGSSRLDITMREFKACVDDIEVLDVQNSGLQFTSNQKLKGADGIIKKLDRIMANMDFISGFMGAHAIFKPYRNSDHSPSGFLMFRAVKKLKCMKKPLRKLLIDKGNLHLNVVRLRDDLDQGRSSFARCLIEVNSEADLMDVVTIGIPSLTRDDFTKETICVEYEWRPPIYDECEIFGHVHDQCPKKVVTPIVSTSIVVTPTVEKGNDGFQTMDKKKKRKGKSKSTNGGPFVGHVVKQNVRYEPKANTNAPKKGATNVGNASNSSFMLKSIGTSFNHDNITSSNLFFALNVDEEEDEEVVENVFDEKLTHFPILKQVEVSCRCWLACLVVSFGLVSSSVSKVEALFSMGDDKSPGPDGYTATFFKEAWTIVGDEVANAIREFFTNGKLLKELNHTIIALIPKVLHGFGFHDRMIMWIMECVTTTSYSISINGNLHGYFQGKRGLRQGDPLSRYLFTLVMEVLTLMFQMRVRETESFYYHHYCDKLELINLFFADDLFLFMHGDVQSARIIKDGLDEFKIASGLTPSIPKSKAYFCNVLNHVKLSILSILPFEEGRLPVKYLGVPSVSSRLKLRDCKELVEKVKLKFLGTRFVFLKMKAGLAFGVWIASIQPLCWCVAGPLTNLVSNRDIHRAGLSLVSRVRDIVNEGVWTWPRDLLDKYHFLNDCSVPILDESNRLEWRLSDGSIKKIYVSQVWSNIRPREAKVPWYATIWFAAGIPRHAFNLWLIIKHKLKTQDRVSIWDASASLGSVCSLCESTPDSHEHLFFLCPFSAAVWSQMKLRAGLDLVSHDVYALFDHFEGISHAKSSKIVIAKIVLAASAYFIWQERNWRLFKKSKRSVKQVVDCIASTVHLKLLSCRFRRSKDGVHYARLWDLPDTIFRC
nr:hypothetical protein [Tanacetum cinerariifolium]